jgi:hypothetical protein
VSFALRVAKGSANHRDLHFQGQWLPVGTEIDKRNYPRVSAIPGKWDLMVDAGYFEDLGEEVLDPERAARRSRLGTPTSSMPEPVVPVDQFLAPQERAEMNAALDKPIGLQCGDCGFQANSAHGLKIHVGRKHASH